MAAGPPPGSFYPGAPPPGQYGAPPGQYGAPPGQYGAPSAYGPPPGYGSGPIGYPSAAPQGSIWGGQWSGGATAVQIVARASDLPKMDGMFGKCDAYLMVYSGTGTTKRQIYKSEVQKANLNPSFAQFNIDVNEAGGEAVPLTWEVWDWDSDGTHDFVGAFTASLAQIQSANASFPITNPGKKSSFGKDASRRGVFHISSAKKITSAAKTMPRAIQFVFRGEKLAKKDITSSDPFLIFRSDPLPSASGMPPAAPSAPPAHTKKAKKSGQKRLVVMAITEVVQKNLNPTWQPLEIELELTGGMNSPIQIDCYDFDRDGTHDLIGSANVTLRDLMSPDPMIPLIDPAKAGGLGYRNSGVLRVSSMKEIPAGAPIPKPPAYEFNISCRKLARMDGLAGTADPFIVIAPYGGKSKGAHGGTTYFKSETIHQNLNPSFKPFVLGVVQCGGLDNPLHFQVWDWDPKGQQLIGQFSTSLRELTFPQIKDHYLTNKKHISKYSGVVVVNSCNPTSAAPTPSAGAAPSPAGHGAPAPYGAPPGQYGAPPGQYGAPPGQYGAPPGQYGAPPGQYGAPPGQYGAPPGQYGAPPGQYGAPPGQYGAPPGQYGAPPGGAPPGQYGAPPGQYGAPPGQYGAPPGGAPPGAYGAPPGGAPPGQYGAPPGGAPPGQYGAPPGSPAPAGFAPPGSPAAGGYGAPPGGAPPGQYGAPPGGAPPGQYGAPSQYGAPPGGAPPGQYGAPPGQYGAPPGQYGAPPGQYGAPSQYGAPPPGQYGAPPGQ